MSQFPTQSLSFTIVAPPKYPWMNKATNFFLAIFVVISIGMVNVIMTAWRGTYNRLGNKFEGKPDWVMPIVIFTVIFFLLGVGLILYRRLVPIEKRAKLLGELQLIPEGMLVQLQAIPHLIPWNAIRRMNVYISRGMAAHLLEESEPPIRKAEVLQLLVHHEGQWKEFCVKNRMEIGGQTHYFYDFLMEVKKSNHSLYQSIQFWDRYK
ncbi:MAG: hypothetical protein AAFY71_10495 [Bacteroidota bacterium]